MTNNKTPRQRTINAVAQCLIFKWSQPIENAVKIATQILVDPFYALGQPERQYVESIDTDEKIKRFIKSVNGVILDITGTEKMTDLLRRGQKRDKVDATTMLYYATGASFHYGQNIKLFHHGIYLERYWSGQGNGDNEGRRVYRNVVTWIKADRTPQMIARSDNTVIIYFDKPSKLEGKNPDVMSTIYTDDDISLVQATRALNLETTHVAILRPSNAVILFDGDPHYGGKSIGYIPQTIGGKTWVSIFDRVEKWESSVPLIIDSVEVVSFKDRPPFDIYVVNKPHDIVIDYELDDPAPPGQEKSSRYYAEKLAGDLFAVGVWLQLGSIKIVNPYECFMNWTRLYQYGTDVNQLGIHIANTRGNEHINYELVVRPVSVKPYDPMNPHLTVPQLTEMSKRVADQIAKSDKHNWDWSSDIYVTRVGWVSKWLSDGVITVDDLNVLWDEKTKTATVQLWVLDPSDDEQTDRIFAQLDIVGSAIMATRCKFSTTAISSIGFKSLFNWLIQNLSDPDVYEGLENKRELVELIDAVLTLGEDENALMNLTDRVKERAYYVENHHKPSPDDNQLVHLVWERETGKFDVIDAQNQRDHVTELVSVCAYDLAKIYFFNPMVINKKTNQYIQRIIRQTVKLSQDHQDAWNRLDATEKMYYANSVKTVALQTPSKKTRPDYMDATS